MTAKTMLGVLAALAVAVTVVVWVTTTPEQASLLEELPRAGLPEESAPEGTMVLPEPIASDPLPLDLPPEVDAPVKEPGFTISVSATQALPTGGKGPPAAATLELGISSGRKELGEPLMAFETEPDGKAQIAFPRSLVPESPEGKRQWLWLRSQGVGLLTRVDYERVPKVDDATVHMSVVVQPGALVEGRILGPDGQPAAGRVDWWWFGEEDITSSHAGMAGTDGLFHGELRYEGRHGLLAAGASTKDDEHGSFFFPEHLDLGTGFSELFDVDFTKPVPFLEVHVSGPGLIHGRVLDSSGVPAVGVSLVAVLAELDDEIGSLHFPYPRIRDLERRGGGHLWMRAATDSEGAFAFHGLRNGLFHVRGAGGENRSFGSSYPILLTERAVPSLGAPLELRLTRPYLAIHVRQADGSVPAQAIQIHKNTSWRSTMDDWPEEPGLLLTLSPRDAHRGGRRGAYLNASSTGPGEFVAELSGDLRVASALELDVGILGGELPWRPQHVVVPPYSGRVDVDLVLPTVEPLGSLLLDVVNGAGTALEKQVRIRVIDPATGVVLVDAPCDYTDEDDWPMRIRLPMGEYRLLVEGHPWINDHHGTIMRRRVHGAHEQSVHIASGVESHVTATLGEAARLAVRVIGSVTEKDREEIRSWQRGEVDEDFTEFWAQFVTMRLEREGRWPEQPKFARRFMEGTSASGIHLFASVAFGKDETSEPLTPGTYTLVATTAGGRVLERVVTLMPGQTLSMTLRFE